MILHFLDSVQILFIPFRATFCNILMYYFPVRIKQILSKFNPVTSRLSKFYRIIPRFNCNIFTTIPSYKNYVQRKSKGTAWVKIMLWIISSAPAEVTDAVGNVESRIIGGKVGRTATFFSKGMVPRRVIALARFRIQISAGTTW